MVANKYLSLRGCIGSIDGLCLPVQPLGSRARSLLASNFLHKFNELFALLVLGAEMHNLLSTTHDTDGGGSMGLGEGL